MERTIRVTGKGKIAVKPDTVRLLITQSDVCKRYEKAVEESTLQKGAINCIIEELGFQKTDLKTLRFDIDAEQESYKENDTWKRRLMGYRYTHRMKLEFPVDDKLLGKLLYRLAHSHGAPELSIEYTVADPEAVKNELLADAVSDSRKKAEVLSRAAGVTLKSIQLIDYSWSEISIVSRPMNDMAMLAPMCREADESYSVDIEPDDIDLTDTVTVVWTIE